MYILFTIISCVWGGASIFKSWLVSELYFLLSCLLFCPLSVSDSQQLGHRTLWCVPAQVPVIPALLRFPSKPLVMAALAPAVAACAHSRPPAHSLSRPIYLTQTRASQPSPAYLSSAWYSLGVSSGPVSLHPGNHNETRGRRASAFSSESSACVFQCESVCICQAICQVSSVKET